MSISGFLSQVAGERPASDGRLLSVVSSIRLLTLSISLLASAGAAEASIVVRTAFEASTIPAGAGVQVYVDGEKIGATAADGRFVIGSLPVGTHLIGAIAPGLAGGAVEIVVKNPTQDRGVDVVLTGEGLGSVVLAALKSENIPVVPLTTTDFSASLVDPATGKARPITKITSVTVERTVSGEILDFTAGFEIVNGTKLRFVAPAGVNLTQYLDADARHVLKVEALNADGALLRATQNLWIGRSRISGSLLPPGPTPASRWAMCSSRSISSGPGRQSRRGRIRTADSPSTRFPPSMSLSPRNRRRIRRSIAAAASLSSIAMSRRG